MPKDTDPYLFEKPEHEKRLDDLHRKPIAKTDLLNAWRKVLESSAGERPVQRFLERHPYMLPGLYDYHHGPLWAVVISQFPLGSDYVPDFAFITVNSAMLQFTFVEIEDPAKRIFNAKMHFTQQFNESFQQIKDWKIGADKNRYALMETYAELLKGIKFQFFDTQFYLICGRREQVQKSQVTKDRWSSIRASLNKDIEVMTYDRLTESIDNLPTEHIRHRLVVCAYKKRSFVVKAAALS